MAAIGAVDTALWDIKAKLAGLPLYQLLGGRSRDGVLVYGHASGETIEQTVESVGGFLERGYKAVRAQSAVPGAKGAYGVTREVGFYEPAASGVAQELGWSTEAYLRVAPKLLEAVRERHGFDFHLLHDAHHRLSPIEAARLGKAVEDCALFWLEDPVPAEHQEGYRLIRQHTTTPLAVGEVFNSIWDCQTLISEQLIDYIRTSVVHAGGVSHLRKIFSFAELYDVRTGSHGATDLSPVCMAAALHVDVSVPNFGIQEYMVHSEQTDAVFPHSYRFEDGYLHPGEEPGIGVELDEQLAGRFPYRPASLPVARRLDGSVHSW